LLIFIFSFALSYIISRRAKATKNLKSRRGDCFVVSTPRNDELVAPLRGTKFRSNLNYEISSWALKALSAQSQ